MNIVFFVESYHHTPLINGVCVKNVVDSLVYLGHTVSVYTTTGNTGYLPKHEVVDGADVFRINRDTLTSCIKKSSGDGKLTKLWKIVAKQYSRIRNFMMLWKWPLGSFFTAGRYEKCAQKHLKKAKIDVIVGTYFHLEEVLAAIKLKKKHPEAVVMTYTLDAMAGRESPIFFNRADIARKSILKWEKYVLEKTDIFCAMEAHREYFSKSSYPENLIKKVRYVDIPLMCIKNNDNYLDKNKYAKKRIVYTGYTSKTTGSAVYLIKLMEKLHDAELHIYGKMDSEVENALLKSGLLDKKIFFHGYVNHKEVERVQNEADFLATFGSLNTCMISGKIFEYMAKKKPLICTYRLENDINLSYIEKYPNKIIIHENDDNLLGEAKRLNDFINIKKFEDIDDEYLKKEFYNNTPEAMAELIVLVGRNR